MDSSVKEMAGYTMCHLENGNETKEAGFPKPTSLVLSHMYWNICIWV